MNRSTMNSNMLKAVDDFRRGLSNWRIWWLLGIGDIRKRYARSRLGQFWITLSMAIFVGVIGATYALIFNQPIRDFLPYVAANFVVWTLISGIISDSCAAFVQAESFLRQEPLPKTVFVMRVLVRHVASFAHNIIILPVVFVAMGQVPYKTWLLFPFGLLLVITAGFFTCLMLGLLCARFRDLPEIVQILLRLAFFVTPVVWPKTALQGHAALVVEYNPLAAFLHVVAEPMQGNIPSGASYLYAIIFIVLLGLVSVPLFARFRARIVYWL